MTYLIRPVLVISLIFTFGLQMLIYDAIPARGADRGAVIALHSSAQTCARMINDAYGRSAALVRLAEVERTAGIGSPQTTLAEAEKAARAVGDNYHLAFALCDVAGARQTAGDDPTALLMDAQSAAESIRIKASLGAVIWDELLAIVKAEVMARGMMRWSPFLPPPAGVNSVIWYAAKPSQRVEILAASLREDYFRQYAARRKDWEALQRQLRDLALVQVSVQWASVSLPRALEVTEKISDPAFCADTVLSLAWLAAPSGDQEAVKLCDRALQMAGALPAGDARVKSLTRAICALLVAAPEQAAAPLYLLRKEISSNSDAALRTLMLGDLAIAAKTHDDKLATELYGEAVKSLNQFGAVNPFGALLGMLTGAAPKPSPYLTELTERGYDILNAGFAIDPALAAEGCETGFRLLDMAGKMPLASPSPAPLSYLQQWALLRLLAAHDLKRELALTETSDSRLTRVWGLAAAAEAVMASEPARAREYLDRAWALTEEERTVLIDRIGLDRNGELKIPSMREISRKGTSEQFALLDQALTLTQTVAAQSYLGVLTCRAGGDKALALERCTHALKTTDIIPEHAIADRNAPATVLFAQASGIVIAATTFADRDAGKRIAAKLLARQKSPGRAAAGTTAAQYLIPVEPIPGLEFLIEAMENAPEQPMNIGSRQVLSDQSVVASLHSLHSYSTEEIASVADRLVKAAKRHKAWMPDAATLLTEMTLIYSGASNTN